MQTFRFVEEPNGVKEPKPSFLKKLRKTVIYLFLAVLVILLGLLSLLFIYEDEVKAAVISELNKHLKAEIKIAPENIDLTIIKTFPDCSIQFKNLLMYEALPVKKRDTLMFAKQLNLHFSMKDLWNKKYNIQKIRLNGAVIKLQVLKSGQPNYIFWQSDTTAKQQPDQGLAFALDAVKLQDCRLSYKDHQSRFKTTLNVSSLSFKGNFNATDFDINSTGKLLVHELIHENTNFLSGKSCEFSVELDAKGDNYTFRKTRINLNQLAFELKGGFVFKDQLKKLDVSFTAPKLDIVSILSLLPEKFKKDIHDYESAGSFYANGNVNYTPETSFAIQSDFGIRNGNITYVPNSTTASQVNLDGQLRVNKNSSRLDLKTIHLNLKEDELNGSCSISDFSEPYIQTTIQARVNLANLQAFLAIDTINTMKGNLKLDAKAEGRLEDLKKQAFSSKVNLELNALVSNLEVGFKNDEHIFAVENCQVIAAERDIEVKDLKLKRGSSDILLNGKLPGFFNYLAEENAPLTISGNLVSNYLKLEDFMVKYKSSGGEAPLIPKNMRFQLNADISRFSYAKFEAQAVKGEIEIKNQKAIVSDMRLQTMGGEAVIDAFADNSKHQLEVVLQSKLKNINISSLFLQLNNFGQSTLQDKNIKGFASADIEFSGSWSNQLEADLSSLHSVCNLTIERGELIDFKPLLSLSRFVEISDLQRIKFADLQSNIRIANNVITFPKTSLKNSALDIDFWGTHSFNNDIDYHIQLLISDLLAKKRKNKDEEFGPVENDRENRRSAFILMTGTVDKPVLKYDRKGMKEKVKADIKEEKQTIKQVLKEELGLFKKDTTVKKAKKSDQYFELEKPGNNPPKKALEPKKKEEEDF